MGRLRNFRMPTAGLLWLAVGLVAVNSCRVDEDCNLNGICTNQSTHTSSCSCLKGWRGTSCGEMALDLATVGAGLHAAPTSNFSSWGGWVGWDEGTQHWQMFANEMVHGCGINSWEANSRVVRASTHDLRFPFKIEAEIKPPFGSEPTLAHLESGEWLMLSIGNQSSSLPPRTDCVGGYTPNSAAPTGTGGNFKGYVPVEVAISPALTADDDWRVVATLGSGDFNPSPLVFPNGTTLLMWRHLARVHMVRANHWTGPFAFNGSDSCPDNGSEDPGCEWWHLFSKQVDDRGLEDPFMYIQPHPSADSSSGVVSHTFHALYHDHKSYGGHAYSRDGVSWTFSDTPPYGNVVNFTDGSSVALQRRERPHLVFDREGYISHLSTGVQPPPTAEKSPPTSGRFQNDYTYTLIQPVEM